MKVFKPSQRLTELDLVKKYDVEQEPIFKEHERFAINQERAKIMAEDISYLQSEILESKIQNTLHKIAIKKWKPVNEIRYYKNIILNSEENINKIEVHDPLIIKTQ